MVGPAAGAGANHEPGRAGRLSLRPHGTAGHLAAGMAHMLTAQKTLRRRRTAAVALIAALTLSSLVPSAGAADGAAPNIAAGSEQNVLVGVGVVIGLPGTGDS